MAFGRCYFSLREHDVGDVLAFAHFPYLLPVVKKRLQQKCISMGETKQVPNSTKSSIIPIRKDYGTIKLWYTIKYHLQPNNTRSTSMVLYEQKKKKK